jgi:hypothetical protein
VISSRNGFWGVEKRLFCCNDIYLLNEEMYTTRKLVYDEFTNLLRARNVLGVFENTGIQFGLQFNSPFPKFEEHDKVYLSVITS